MDNTNPLDKPGTAFEMELMNPNPTSSKNKDGAVYRLSFEVTRDKWDFFMDADCKGMLIAAKLCVADMGQDEVLNAESTKDTQKTTKKPYGSLVAHLHSINWFMQPAVIQACGTEDEYKHWVQRQPSALSGEWSEWLGEIGEGRSVYAHINSVGNGGGMATKSPYGGIPMKQNEEHSLQHQQGYDAIGGKEKLEKLRLKHVTTWVKMCLENELQTDSLGNVPPEEFIGWCAANGVNPPQKYMDEV